jgi:hypothetical protein
VISRLNTRPARTPVNALLRPHGSPTHDSGPPWIATPSVSGVLLPFLVPVYPGAFHRFHGLRPYPPGSALPRPTRHRAGGVTTRQASLNVTDRSIAHPVNQGVRRWASAPPVSRRHRQPATGPPGGYPDRTYTGKRRRAYESAINHSHDQPPILSGCTGRTTLTPGAEKVQRMLWLESKS